MNFTLYNDDCLNALKEMDDNSIDSCVTDPPYGLSSKGNSKGGFMGLAWDYDVPQKEIWQEVFRVLKPGGHLLAFFGSRTYHRGAIQIEDAGFEIRDQIMWLYGSGFPKSHNIGKAIDSAAGVEREVVGIRTYANGTSARKTMQYGSNAYNQSVTRGENNVVTAPATDEAKQWDGWGTALKPSHEPIVVARKPITQTVAKNVLEYGTGALNIDGCRVEANGEKTGSNGAVGLKPERGWNQNSMSREVCREQSTTMGRWPANVIHDGSDEVVQNFPDAGGGFGKRGASTRIYGGGQGFTKATNEVVGYGDSGSAARFFYCAKASKSDREDGNTHPTVKPTDLMRYLCRLVTPKGGTVLDPFMGSGSTGKAALLEGFKFIGIEREKEYYKIAQKRIEYVENNRNSNLEDFFT